MSAPSTEQTGFNMTNDANGLRVIKVLAQAPTYTRFYSLYDGTELISEFADYSTTTYTSGTTPAQAPADSVSLMLYQFSDHLTTRMSADNFASNASFEGHYPFGETWYDTGMAYPSITKKFTSYNKDTEASSAFLNYAVHRQHSARLGRFHMADPVHGSTSNPQSLNRFSYGLGDPINNIDPQGLFNVKVEIPADWPCNPADNVACGCDPFESPFCGIGGSYPPSSSGGGGGTYDTNCLGHLSGTWPGTVKCDGITSYFSQMELRDSTGNLPPTTNVSYGIQTSANVRIATRASIPSDLKFEAWFVVSSAGNYRYLHSGYIKWIVTYTCHGQTYLVSTPALRMRCLGTI